MFGFEGLGKLVILGGVFLIIIGLLLTFWHKIPFLGKLPGDITVQSGGFHFFFPLVTCLIISLVLTLTLNFVFRVFR